MCSVSCTSALRSLRAFENERREDEGGGLAFERLPVCRSSSRPPSPSNSRSSRPVWLPLFLFARLAQPGGTWTRTQLLKQQSLAANTIERQHSLGPDNSTPTLTYQRFINLLRLCSLLQVCLRAASDWHALLAGRQTFAWPA